MESRFQSDARPLFETLVGTPELFCCPSSPNRRAEWEVGWLNPVYLNPIHFSVYRRVQLFRGFSAGRETFVFRFPPFPTDFNRSFTRKM